MLKLFIKLAIVGLVANAGYRVGTEYLAHVKFRDAVRESAMFKARNDDELMQRIMDLAVQYDIPIREDGVSIERLDRQVSVQGSYEKRIEVVPTLFYPWRFNWSIDVITSTLLPPPPKPK